MWLASEMAAFAQVCDLQSFTAAARALGVPKVAVSRAIVSLERRLGTRLLTRTTRRVALTPAGALLRPHCQRLLSEVEAVRARIASAAAADRRLRIAVDGGYGRLLVTPLVPRFLERYDFELQVALLDTLPDGPSELWDVLVCNGEVRHPELIQTALGSPSLLLCATPAYLASHGRPRQPGDLDAHSVLRTVDQRCAADMPAMLRLRRGSEQQQVRLRPALRVSDPSLVHSSMAAGLGIGVLPEFLCRQGLAMGKLERVLPEWWVAEALQLQAVHAQRHADSSTIRQFLEFLLANMAPALGHA
jgi:DNA-binding transcriptional LysR family regulator